MATDAEPNGDKVFDPLVGKDRDAFPDEVVPPEQQSTMQRLMAAGKQQFRALYDFALGTGQLTQDELNGILKAGQLKAEAERQKYLEAIRSNPEIILRGLLGKISDSDTTDSRYALNALNNLDSNLDKIQKILKSAQAVDVAAGKAIKPTIEYLAQQPIELFTIFPSQGRERECANAAFRILQDIGCIPVADVSTLSDLKTILSRAQNSPDSGKAYVDSIGSIDNLTSAKAGLEGISAQVRYSSYVFDSLTVQAKPSTVARIFDNRATVNPV